MTLAIDAHQHFWRIDAPWHQWPQADLPAIHRDFLPGDLAPALQRCDIAGTVLVQSQPDAGDTDWMLALATGEPAILGVVGWVDMIAPDAPDRIEALAARPKLKGLRPMLQDLPVDWILQPSIAPALAAMVAHDLVLDALIRPFHLPAIGTLADQYQRLRIVVDHGAKPEIAADGFESWAAAIARLGAHPNVACKLSGLVTEAGDGWTPADLGPFVQHIMAVFGPERVLWGSDWPVLLLQSGYTQWHETARAMVPEAQRDAVFGGNAGRIYRLLAGN